MQRRNVDREGSGLRTRRHSDSRYQRSIYASVRNGGRPFSSPVQVDLQRATVNEDIKVSIYTFPNTLSFLCYVEVRQNHAPLQWKVGIIGNEAKNSRKAGHALLVSPHQKSFSRCCKTWSHRRKLFQRNGGVLYTFLCASKGRST